MFGTNLYSTLRLRGEGREKSAVEDMRSNNFSRICVNGTVKGYCRFSNLNLCMQLKINGNDHKKSKRQKRSLRQNTLCDSVDF